MSFTVTRVRNGWIVEDGPLMGTYRATRTADAGTHVEERAMEPRPERLSTNAFERMWQQGYVQALVDLGVKPEQTAQWLAERAWERESDKVTVGQGAERVEAVGAERDAYGRRMERLGNPDE
jgi:hypothetical protein